MPKRVAVKVLWYESAWYRTRLLAQSRSAVIMHVYSLFVHLFDILIYFFFSPYIWRKSYSKVLYPQPFGQPS